MNIIQPSQTKEYRREYNKRVAVRERQITRDRMRSQFPRSIWTSLFKRATKKDIDICKLEDFIEWYENKEKICCYCGIKQELLKPLNWGQGKRIVRLEIERKDNNGGYTIDNIDLACAVCNSVKNAFFSEDEMKRIGNIINKIWRKKRTKIRLIIKLKNKVKRIIRIRTNK